MGRDDVTSTAIRRHFGTICPLSKSLYEYKKHGEASQLVRNITETIHIIQSDNYKTYDKNTLEMMAFVNATCSVPNACNPKDISHNTKSLYYT